MTHLSCEALILAKHFLIQVCKLTIIDDSQTPQVEGNESFIVDLNSAVNARIAQPSEAIILINDTLNDSQLILFCHIIFMLVHK